MNEGLTAMSNALKSRFVRNRCRNRTRKCYSVLGPLVPSIPRTLTFWGVSTTSGLSFWPTRTVRTQPIMLRLGLTITAGGCKPACSKRRHATMAPTASNAVSHARVRARGFRLVKVSRETRKAPNLVLKERAIQWTANPQRVCCLQPT